MQDIGSELGKQNGIEELFVSDEKTALEMDKGMSRVKLKLNIIKQSARG